MRVGGRFAGEVSGVEFREGGVDVVGVEHDDVRRPVVGVDLDDVEHIGVECLVDRCHARKRTTEDETLAAGRDGCLT